jgi:hypothetical protein
MLPKVWHTTGTSVVSNYQYFARSTCRAGACWVNAFIEECNQHLAAAAPLHIAGGHEPRYIWK